MKIYMVDVIDVHWYHSPLFESPLLAIVDDGEALAIGGSDVRCFVTLRVPVQGGEIIQGLGFLPNIGTLTMTMQTYSDGSWSFSAGTAGLATGIVRPQ